MLQSFQIRTAQGIKNETAFILPVEITLVVRIDQYVVMSYLFQKKSKQGRAIDPFLIKSVRAYCSTKQMSSTFFPAVHISDLG